MFPNTYRAATLANGTVNIVSWAFPHSSLDEDTVVIRPSYVGICRADVKEVIGSRDIPTDRGPLFGHELVGSLVHAGSSTGFRQGELVTFNPNITPDRTTGFAEYVFVRGSTQQLSQAVVRLASPAMPYSIWMPEPFACIIHATRKLLELANLPSLAGRNIGIIGAGCSGLMFAMCAKHLGASTVVFNRGEMRLNFARDRDLLAEQETRRLGEAKAYRSSFDIVIVVPTIITTRLLEEAAGMAIDGGILHVYGGTRAGDRFPTDRTNIDAIRRQERIELVDYEGKRLKICGAYGCFREDYEDGFHLHAQHHEAFPLERLISKEIRMEEFPGLITSVAAGDADYPGKVLIKIDG